MRIVNIVQLFETSFEWRGTHVNIVIICGFKTFSSAGGSVLPELLEKINDTHHQIQLAFDNNIRLKKKDNLQQNAMYLSGYGEAINWYDLKISFHVSFSLASTT